MGYKGKGPLSYMGIDKALPEIFTATTSPTAASSAPDLGDFWINTTLSKMYILLSKPAGVANWLEMDRQYDFQESVLAQAAIGAAVAAEGNRYLCNATGGGWTDTYIYEYHDAAWVPTVPTDGMVVFDEDTNGYLFTMLLLGVLSLLVSQQLPLLPTQTSLPLPMQRFFCGMALTHGITT